MDTIEYPELVAEFVDKIAEHEVAVVRSVAGCGIDGWMIADDMGIHLCLSFPQSLFPPSNPLPSGSYLFVLCI